jgi:hypothetical protein
MSIPLAITPTVPAWSDPTCAAVSIPRASPETMVAPASLSPIASWRAKRHAAAEALRAPTMATHVRSSSSSLPRRISAGGALSSSASSAG